jgi:acyl-homoserine lactone acylase PvdQ
MMRSPVLLVGRSPLRHILLVALAAVACAPRSGSVADVERWEARAERVRIVRDDWGVPHVYGETDADVVFGMIYAQAEDDFDRIEINLLNAQGRLAEAEGEAEIWRDLRMKLFIDPAQMRAAYASSPAWLRQLMDAWADGLNYFLHTRPEVEPRVLDRFEPWMALTFTEGSIGGDIERVSLEQLEAFYGREVGARGPPARPAPSGVVAAGLVEPDPRAEPLGSNGIAIAPSNTRDGNALLLINPHTSFYFREELHMVSGEGLNAYGAVTWGQLFVYQGFNETAGWMHTSSGVDNIDEFLESVVERGGSRFYRYGTEERPVETRRVTVRYRTGSGMAERSFTTYRTHHGPIVREADDGRWVSVALMHDPVNALIQSYSRTKARDLDEFIRAMRGHTNSSNNTVFADASGNIAYLHANFIPIRDPRFDYTRPVDGSDPSTDWQGVHSVEESPNVVNPASGWVQNTNNWPFSAAGSGTLRQEDYPAYVERGGENARGVHAMRLLEGRRDFTLASLRDAAFDTYMPGFEESIPALVRAYDALAASDPLRTRLAEPIEVLRDWDLRWSVESVATSLAVFWGTRLGASATAPQMLDALVEASDRLAADFGDWRTPWGEINRFQRLTGDVEPRFDDDEPSTPVGFVSGRWGSLASFAARAYPGTRRWYGNSGNSFVAVVEFGARVRARAVTAGGLNSVPGSPHFDDQAARYATGELRDVYFYPEDLQGHVEREYRPGR